MATKKRTEHQRESDLELISSLYCKGKYQSEIAEIIGVSQPQIAYDLQEIHKRWREASAHNINEAKQRELTRIDNLERAAWESFERSKETFVSTTNETESKGERDKDNKPIASKGRVSKRTEERYGDPRFLMVVKECIDKRCKILGLDAPLKVEDVTPPRPIERMTQEEIEAEIQKITTNGIGRTRAAHSLN